MNGHDGDSSESVEKLLMDCINKNIDEYIGKLESNDTEVKLLKKYLELCKSNALPNVNLIFRKIMELGCVESQCDIILSNPLLYKSFNVILKGIKNYIKGCLSQLWALIATHMQLKSWSISGDAGVNLGIFKSGVTLKLDFQ